MKSGIKNNTIPMYSAIIDDHTYPLGKIKEKAFESH